MVRNEERSDCSEMSGYGENPNRKCISGSDGGLIPARSRDHTGLWLLSVAKLIAKVRTFAADFCSKESPAEPMTGKPLQNLRALFTRFLPSILGLDCACQPLLFGDHEDSST